MERTAGGAVADAESGDLVAALAAMVEEMSEIDLRRVLIATMTGRPPMRDAMSGLLAVDALRECRAAGACPGSFRAFDDWRVQQRRPEDWPSGAFISEAFRGKWAAAIREAGIDFDEPQASSVRDQAGKHTAQDLAGAIHEWIEETIAAQMDDADPSDTVPLSKQRAVAFESADLTEEAYLCWARERRAGDPHCWVPAHPTYPGKFFGGWRSAVDAAHPEATLIWKASEKRAAAEAVKRSRTMVRHIRDAFAEWSKAREGGNERQKFRFTRRAYDTWAVAHWAEQDNKGAHDAPRSSKRIVVCFGSWPEALAAAGVERSASDSG